MVKGVVAVAAVAGVELGLGEEEGDGLEGLVYETVWVDGAVGFC